MANSSAVGGAFLFYNVEYNKLKQSKKNPRLALARSILGLAQCDFDTVGSISPVIDAEIVAMNYTILTRLGFRGNFSVRINDRRLLNAMVKSLGVKGQEQVLAVFRGWDKLEKADRQSVREELKEVGIEKNLIQKFDSVTEKLLSLAGQKADTVLSGIGKVLPTKEVGDAIANIEQIVGFIASMAIPEEAYRIWPLLARGLDYYTGPIFETVVETAGIGSVTGGGRFDNLIAQMGGPDMPASGSSFGLERVMGVMEQLGLKPKSSQATVVFVTLFDLRNRELCKASFEVATALRLKDYPVEVYTGEVEKLSRQLEIADKKNIPFAVILGPDELRQNSVAIKDLRQGKGSKQVTVSVNQVVSQIETMF